jgi:hypothetical protein
MRSALLTISVLTLGGALLCSPQASAHAQVLNGLKAAADNGNLLTLVGRGGRGGGSFRGGGHGGFKGGHIIRGGGGRAMHAYRGGGGRGIHGYGGDGGRAMHAYRGGGGKRYAYGGHRGHYDNLKRHGNYDKYRRYGYYGGYRRYGYYGVYRRFGYYGGYGYYGGGCGWLYRNAVATGSAYWWNRYYACRGY